MTEPEKLEIWGNRVFASSPDEAALKIREATGFKEGKLCIKEIIPNNWYEFRIDYVEEKP